MYNRKNLAIKLSKLKGLEKFNIDLEQYQTDTQIASELLWVAYQNGDIKDKTIADFGSGNGIFGIGALLLGAKIVYFIDIDKNTLEICKKNLLDFGINNYYLLNLDVSNFDKKVDTVLMNPPFGVQKRKADKRFLEIAMKFSDKIYSIHKIESKNFIEVLCEEKGFNVLDIIEREFVIPKIYKFHTKNKHLFSVGIWILGRNI